MTCMVIASKYYELDENITLVNELRRYYTRVLPTTCNVPSFSEIVECERENMYFFKWNLNFSTNLSVLNIILSNGVIFENEPMNDKELFAKNVAANCH